MRNARLTGSLVAVAGIATSLLVAPFASPAQAAEARNRLWTTQDTNYDGLAGLYYSDGPVAYSELVEEPAYTHVYGLSASADGSRIIYLRDSWVPSVEDVKQEVIVRDTSRRVVRVLETTWYSKGLFPGVARLSPDGSRAVWRLMNNDGDYWLRKATVASGASTTLIGGFSPYAFLDNSTVLFQTAQGVTFTMPFTGGPSKAASGIPLDAIDLTVSPDGTKVAWALLTATEEPFRSTLQVAPLTLSGGTASVSSPTTVFSESSYNRHPDFSPDGSTLYWRLTAGTKGAWGDLWSAPAGGGFASQSSISTQNVFDLAITYEPSSDTVSPGATSSLPAKLKGTQAVLDWTLPADGDLSGTVLIRKNGSTTVTRFLPAPISYLVDSGLTLGTTYTYTFAPVDRAGRSGPSSSRTLTALQAKPTFSSPTSLTSNKASFPVTFGPAAGPATTFEVDYFPTGGTPAWRDWVTGAAGKTRTFGAPASTGVAATTSTAGTTYAFRSRGHDGYGNATDWTTGAITATVPFDQTKATFSGGSNVYHSAAYLGSYRKLWKATAYAKATLKGDRVFIVGSTCGTCGRFDLFDNGTWIGTFDTYGSVTRLRQTLFAKSVPHGTHTFTIKPKATPGRPNVMLDGFGMRTPAP